MSKLNVETIENLSATASLNVSDIASKNAFIADTGAALVGFKANGVGAVNRTVDAKLKEFVSVKDFGAVGDGVTDAGPQIRALFDSLPPGSHVHVQKGVYVMSPVSDSTYCLLIDKNIRISFDPDVVFKTTSNTRAVIKITTSTEQDWTGLTVDGDFKTNFGIEVAQSGVSIAGAKSINFYPTVTALGSAAYYILNSSDVSFYKCLAGNVQGMPNGIVGDSQGVAAGFLFLGAATVYGTNSVVNCTVDNVYNSASEAYEDEDGINTQTTNTLSVITGNTFKRCMKRGIKMFTPGVVRDNTIISSRGVAANSNVMFAGISVYRDGVTVENNRIESATMGGSFSYGIEIGGLFGVKSCVVKNNHITFVAGSYLDSAIGIFLVGDSVCDINENVIIYPDTGVFSKYGIRCIVDTESRVPLQISKNTVVNAGYGVWTQGAVTGRISENTITCDGSNIAIFIDRGAMLGSTPYAADIIFESNVATVDSSTSAYCVRIQDTQVTGCVAIGNKINLGTAVGINGKHTEIASSNRVSVFYGSSPSTVFSDVILFIRGDTIINSDCRDASPVRAWTCRYGNTASTSASWSVNGFMLMKGATVSRPTLTTNDVGVQYMDTTLSANGRLITWSGFAWLDTTGTAV